MNYRKPKYYDQSGTLLYEADSCVPLRNAWENHELELTTLARGTYPGEKLKSHELPGVKSVGYWDVKKKQDWGLDWHTNEGIEICFLESGNLDFLLRDDIIHLKTNDITITRPWIVHKIGSPHVEPSKLHWLIFDVNVRHPHQLWEWPEWVILSRKDLNELTVNLRQNEQPVWNASREFRNCFLQMAGIIREKNRNYESKLKVLINNLFILLLDIIQNENVFLDQSLVETKRSVQLFLSSLESSCDEDWNVDKMAEYCNIGVTRFTHYCRGTTNCSPMEYLNQLRLHKAAKLLSGIKKLPVVEIAYICGFSSPQYFNYSFRKHFDKTPSEFRRANRTA